MTDLKNLTIMASMEILQYKECNQVDYVCISRKLYAGESYLVTEVFCMHLCYQKRGFSLKKKGILFIL